MDTLNFKPVVGIVGYSVSCCGKVRNDKTGRFLKGSVRPDGYTQITMGRGVTKLLHAMILEAHVGPRPTGMLGLHADDIKANNVLSNLAWGTPKKNAEQRVVNRRARGLDAASAKLTREQVQEICKRLDAGEKMKPIAATFGIEVSLVGLINTGQAWQWLTGRTPQHGRKPEHHNHARKLNATKAREIARASVGTSQRRLAETYGVAHQTVADILAGRIWSHATGIGKV